MFCGIGYMFLLFLVPGGLILELWGVSGDHLGSEGDFGRNYVAKGYSILSNFGTLGHPGDVFGPSDIKNKRFV